MENILVTERDNQLPIIKTNRLILRDIQQADVTEDYLTWLNDFETTKYLEIRRENQTEEKVRKYIDEKIKDIVNTMHFGIYDKKGTRLVGTVTLPSINWADFSSDISFVIGHPDARGNDYATEAVRGVVYYMFHYRKLKRLWAGYYKGHGASARVLEKNGFNVTKILKNKLLNYKNEKVDNIIVELLSKDYQYCLTNA